MGDSVRINRGWCKEGIRLVCSSTYLQDPFAVRGDDGVRFGGMGCDGSGGGGDTLGDDRGHVRGRLDGWGGGGGGRWSTM